MENNRECYHCAGNHPELTVPLFAYGFGFAPEEMDETERAERRALRLLLTDKHAAGRPTDCRPGRSTISTTASPASAPSACRSTARASRTPWTPGSPAGGCSAASPNAKLGGLSFWTQPNSWHHFMSDHIVTFSVLPLDAGAHAAAHQVARPQGCGRRRRLRSRQAHRGLAGDQRAGRRRWSAICQEGARSPAYEPGPTRPTPRCWSRNSATGISAAWSTISAADMDMTDGARLATAACLAPTCRSGIRRRTTCWSAAPCGDETHDVKTFVLAAREPRRFAYKPGQFLTFELRASTGETIHRCYTISAAPTRPHAVSITVKRVPGGPVSNWLHDNLKPGVDREGARARWASSPASTTRRDKYLFLSGGSGITPLMSMTRTVSRPRRAEGHRLRPRRPHAGRTSSSAPSWS